MTDSYSGLHDPYEDQLAAARYRAERDQARQELERERHRRKLAESAADERETVRAEDHDAAAWVRKYGGLEKAKLDAACLNAAENTCDNCNYAREVTMLDGSRITVCDGQSGEMEQVNADDTCDDCEPVAVE